MNSPYFFVKLLILIVFGVCLSDADGLYGTCEGSFSCGNISGFGYPFRRNQDPAHCGYPGFELDCDEQNLPTIDITNITYQILSVDPTSQILRIVREDMIDSTCPKEKVNTTIDHNLFGYIPGYINISFLFGCPVSINSYGMGSISCDNNGGSPVFYSPGIQVPESCETSVIVLSPDRYLNPTDLGHVLQQGFEVRYLMAARPCIDCANSGGQCIYNNDTHLTTCACPEPPFLANSCYTANTTNTTRVDSSSPSGSGNKSFLSIVLPTIGAVLVGFAIGWGLFVCRQRQKRRTIKVAADSKRESKATLTTDSSRGFTSDTQSNITSSIKEYGKCSYFGAQVFTYEELELATDNFNDSRELGDGGYGTVYHGKLLDGREVAVKRLYDNNFKRVEQFMNEVEILTRLTHKNLVKLYGCTSKRSRELLLVYEYIPNGTVADHLHGKLANTNSNSSCLFTWSVRLNIAIETAEALTYLHDSDIIHRDVKTSNILLDKSFRVKVADFGLSRLFPNNATHVSTAPQGTPGYVDPEYYQCYQLTDKSDVYSFGVVLIELISSLQAVDTNRDRLDINLSSMGVNKIQNHMLDELVDKSIGFETDGLVRRKVTLVAELAFRCLQQETDMRPPMKEVLEILKGIQNDELNVQKPEVLDILVDDGVFFKDHNTETPSPDYRITNKLYGSTMPNSSSG